MEQFLISFATLLPENSNPPISPETISVRFTYLNALGHKIKLYVNDVQDI